MISEKKAVISFKNSKVRGIVRLSNVLVNFPNLESLEIYGDGYGLTQLEVTNDSLEYFKKIKCIFKFVIFLKLI